jgi:hypothetical protein
VAVSPSPSTIVTIVIDILPQMYTSKMPRTRLSRGSGEPLPASPNGSAFLKCRIQRRPRLSDWLETAAKNGHASSKHPINSGDSEATTSFHSSVFSFATFRTRQPRTSQFLETRRPEAATQDSRGLGRSCLPTFCTLATRNQRHQPALDR